MSRLRLKGDLELDYIDDVKRIVRIAKSHGFYLSEVEAEMAWDIRSKEWSAGWLTLGTDQQVWDDLLEYALEIVEDEDE